MTSVLIVDDAPDWRLQLAGLIMDTYSSWKVCVAGSQAEAKELLSGEVFELAIIDIRLDESDEENTEGLALAEYINEHYPQTTSLIITGYASLETVKRAMQPDESGRRLVFDYIEKNTVHTDLLEKLALLFTEQQ